MSAVSFDSVTSDTCFHCGQRIRTGVFHVFLEGRERPMCCAGCAAVAETIVASGLTDFYRHRSVDRVPPAELVPNWLTDAESYDIDGVRQNFVETDPAGISRAELLLEGLTCPACAWLVEQRLKQTPGLVEVQVNYTTRRARLAWKDGESGIAAALRVVAGIGLKARPYDAQSRAALRTRERRQRIFELAVAGLGMMQVMMYAVPVYLADAGDVAPEWASLMQWASLALTLPVVVFSARTFFTNAWRDLSHQRVGMDVPIALAIALTFAAGVWTTVTGRGEAYFDSVTMFVFLLLVARWLEAESRERALDAIERIGHAPPSAAHIARDYPDSRATERIASAALKPDDIVLVDGGAVIPADGRIVDGESEVSDAVMTGESLPVLKRAGDAVLGGAVNAGSPLWMRVTHAGADTALARIVRLTGRALDEKPNAVQLADRIAGRFSIVIVLLAALTALAWLHAGGDAWFRHAVAVLVVTCPCALALATPSALTAATARLSRSGLLVTRGHAIETLAALTDVVFDKTGTLTQGEMRVSRVIPLGPSQEPELLAWAAALEQGSPHPLASAIVRAAHETATCEHSAVAMSHSAGHGIEGRIGGRTYRIGTAPYVGAIAGSPLTAPKPAAVGQSHVLLGRAREWLAWIEVDDTLRADARDSVAQLEALGIDVHLVSGDAPGAVHAAGEALGIAPQRVRNQATPQTKLDYVARLQSSDRRVAMVGDGMNDVPVLARADLSVAMGLGTDLARSQADAVLLSGRLTVIADAVRVARQARQVIGQNLAWAIAYNAVAVPLAMAGWVSPWAAAIGMSLSSIAVVANAARLSRR